MNLYVLIKWFCFCIPAVEDKVKDQLEAANPEPVIEEVVSEITPAHISVTVE